MNELALFAGARGGLLAGHVLGWKPVCAVEIEPYCQDVLLARQRDGFLPAFPIWDDVRTFDGHPWRGHVDIVTGGFPCQPFSSASRGRKVAIDLWPEMLRIVGEVQPRWVFAENVAPAPIDRACDDLEALGYRVAATKLSAADVGAPMHRARYWLAGIADTNGESGRALDAKAPWLPSLASAVSWPAPPGELGVADGLANGLDRLRALGNGQVPAVAVGAFRLLANELGL